MTGDPVSVWFVPTAQPETLVAALAGVLDPDERRRADAIQDQRRHAEFVVAHGALRLVLAELLDVPAASIGWRRGPHGKPELAVPDAALRCNLSHSDGLAAFAVTGSLSVGIDVQRRCGAAAATGLAARYYSVDEAEYVAAAATGDERASRFTGLWSRKEACVKATGGRLIPGLRRPVRGPAGAGWQLVTDPEPAAQRYLVRDLPTPAGYCAAVAVAVPGSTLPAAGATLPAAGATGATGPPVTTRWWSPPAPDPQTHDPIRMAVARC